MTIHRRVISEEWKKVKKGQEAERRRRLENQRGMNQVGTEMNNFVDNVIDVGSSDDSIDDNRRIPDRRRRTTRRANLQCRRRLARTAAEIRISSDSDEQQVENENFRSSRRNRLEGQRQLRFLDPERESFPDNEINIVNESPELFSNSSSSNVDTINESNIPVWNNEIIDQPETAPDFGSLSSALTESNRRVNREQNNRNTGSLLIDDTIIEISDSPVVPRIIPEIINIDDDVQVARATPPLGTCPVCLDNLRTGEIMSTICGHVFCSTCLKGVMKSTKKCPSCRKNLTLKTVHPLFL